MKASNSFILYLALCAVATIAHAADSKRIALEIVEPPERRGVVTDFPASVGLVFLDGELISSQGGALVNDRGEAVPFEAEATGWWSPAKQSVKWLLLHFRASTDQHYFFEIGREPRRPEGPPLAIADPMGVKVMTGPLEARVANGSGRLFEEIKLNGKSCLDNAGLTPVLATDDGACTLGQWIVTLEESTPARAIVSAGGFFLDARQTKVARLEVRMEFFQGECFVRLHHTLTWMVKDTKLGVRELSLRLAPKTAGVTTAHVGLSDFLSDCFVVTLTEGSHIAACQNDAADFRITSSGQDAKNGEHLGGWLALNGNDGAGVGICVANMWQMYPSGFSVDGNKVGVNLWPAETGRMGFDYTDIMPPDFYNKKEEWSRYPWSKESGHFEHEYGKISGFLHTAEGAARTHELTLHFFDKASRRTTAELNSLAQHPLAVRQDPRSAMRAPFMGFDLTAVDREHYPDIEHAIDQIGHLTTARWPQIHDYGWWRFGMIRWAAPGGALYRWFDGTQYDLQLIPWLLWLRGGGREFFEEGQITSGYAMDVSTNHYNTRGAPTGFQQGAGGMPFPIFAHHLHKAAKIHFLAYDYHLTGDRRAKEVMDEVIAGTKKEAQTDAQPRADIRRGWARELYNMCVFWANAYEETFDPEIKTFAREWYDLAINREFNAPMSEFRNPPVYLYNGLVAQQRLWNDPKAREIILQNMAHHGYPALEDGGVWDTEKAIACGWAFEQTHDQRFVTTAWDVSRALADLVMDHDLRLRELPQVPYSGNQLSRHLLMPILVGESLAAKQGLGMDAPFVRSDTLISLDAFSKTQAVGDVRLRPRHDGDLMVRVLIATRTQVAAAPITVTAYDDAGQKLAEMTLTMKPPVQTPERYFDPHWFFVEGKLTVAGALRGKDYSLRLVGEGKEGPMALVLADAQIVHHVAAGQMVDFYQEAGQTFAGARVFTKTTADSVKISNVQHSPFTIRDATTGALLFHSAMTDPPITEHALGKGRLIFLTVPGHYSAMRFEGVSPWLSATKGNWFEPAK